MSLEELRAELAGHGLPFGYGALWRFFHRRDWTRKKTLHASEQERPDVMTRRQAWFDGQTDLDPERVVFIDETWASTNMARIHGRCPRGERPRGAGGVVAP